MKNILFRIIGILLISIGFFACKKGDDISPVQTIITNDTSSISGRLVAKLYDINSSFVQGADVKLYADYNDVVHDFPLLSVLSNSAGEADFGYILIGNYYLVAQKLSGPTIIADTVAAQVISQRRTERLMILK